ncbi:MAG: glycosyl hydrolase 53 family protein [Calditrichae bacterium]|nr:glycosyl hydrolase 53 family protein [Calditrichia bacterium]
MFFNGPLRRNTIILYIILTAAAGLQASADSLFIKGADVSFIPQIEDLGGVYKENGVALDPLKILADHGVNYIRLKIWHTPSQNYNDLPHILEMAKRIKQNDMQFLLNFHYSDTWADPGNQTKPVAWQDASTQDLIDSVYFYTKYVMSALDAQGTLPDMVQIGNEINSGMLWNTGRVGGAYDNSTQWANLAALINAGIQGVRESSVNGDSVKIVIHRADADDLGGNTWFFNNLINNGVEFDIIGLSFYPWWHGTLSGMQSTTNSLANLYGKPILIAETAYPWTLDWYDSVNNIVGSADKLHSGYPATVNGQTLFLHDVMQIVRYIGNDRGLGVFYWAPEYISVPQLGSPWENLALFDFQGNALSTLQVFEDKPDSLNTVNITIRLNTATNWDTIQTNHVVQLRGEVKGISLGTLPDGKKISWDADSDIILKNSGGDYWQTTFQMYSGDEIAYKFWSGYSFDQSTYQRGGWEGPVAAFNGSTTNTRNFIAGDKDSLVTLQYYNSFSTSKDQYWTPILDKPDSVGVYFRVNMGSLMQAGLFDPELNGPVSVRGDSISSAGILSWNQSNLILSHEQYSIGGGTFWSGVVYLPVAELRVNDNIEYKFYFEKDNNNGWENGIANRELKISEGMIHGKDTTLHWVNFNNNLPLSIDKNNHIIPKSTKLYQNFPNPFNPNTQITFNLQQADHVKLIVYNLLGEEIIRLSDKYLGSGLHKVLWNGNNALGVAQSSGVYLIRLQSGKTIQSVKALLIR